MKKATTKTKTHTEQPGKRFSGGYVDQVETTYCGRVVRELDAEQVVENSPTCATCARAIESIFGMGR